jgi:hypothetical protein
LKLKSPEKEAEMLNNQPRHARSSAWVTQVGKSNSRDDNKGDDDGDMAVTPATDMT